MLKAQVKNIYIKDNKADNQQNIEEYQQEILDALTEIGKYHLINVSDCGYMATIFYWEKE